jgi:anti-anti-sigma factor
LPHVEQFSWSSRSGIAVMRPAGEVDLSSTDPLRDGCLAAIDASSGPHLVVDLTDTTFMDSSALGVFVGIATELEAAGGWLRFAAVSSPIVAKVLEITQVDLALGAYATVEDAIDA